MSSHEHQNARLLVVDDDPDMRSGLKSSLCSTGYCVDTAEDGVAALEIAAMRTPDVVVTDLRMPRMDGIALLGRLHERDATLPVVVMSAFGDLRTAQTVMRAGATDYLCKPVDKEALELVLTRALRAAAQSVAGGSEGLRGLVGTSAPMQRVYRTARKVAGSHATVLLTGESGTGKGELARAIHSLSPRAAKPFVALHCASLVDSLLESELFGHEKGAFTGADRRRIGRFEEANGGTLFLDEIGELSPLMQVKVLRVLQEHTFERVGSNEQIHVDVRLVAATNRDLAADVGSGRFREDLYYRLNVVHIDLPPLRIRGADVLALIDYFLHQFALENHKQLAGLTDRARARLAADPWPGNVRALQNAIERAVVLCERPLIDEDDLQMDAASEALAAIRVPGSTMADLERHAILKTLESCNGSTVRAAEILEISVRTIQYRLRQYGLNVARSSSTVSARRSENLHGGR